MQNIDHDSLTSLETNKSLIQKLNTSKSLNYFLINVDNFSSVNDAFGYDVGDKVLIQIATHLKRFTLGTSSLYRSCSDKFIIIDERKLDDSELEGVAKSILSFFSDTNIVIDEDIELKISFSVGISRGRGVINITQAELAIKELRECKRNYFKIFNPASKFIHDQQQNLHWMHKILNAIEEENIVAYFQPIVNNHTGEVEKYECLARIKNDDEVISPHHFMKAAKDTGNLAYITKAMITQSFKKFNGTAMEFSINITDSDLSQDYLEEFLLRNIAKCNINPGQVVLELLEDIQSLDKGSTLKQLTSLRENGFKIAIDDFGAEHSNFSRLLDIKPDYIKIDGSFVKNIVTDGNSQIIVDAIILICRKLDIKIIAEYIHSQEVQQIVKQLGIDYSQGYYFGEPSLDLKVL